jgi:GDP-L-fucose synthase
MNIIIEKQTNKFELINLGYGESFSIKRLIEIICSVSEKELTFKYLIDKPTIGFNINIDISKASSFGWEPSILLFNGIKKTISWYKEYCNVY